MNVHDPELLDKITIEKMMCGSKPFIFRGKKIFKQDVWEQLKNDEEFISIVLLPYVITDRPDAVHYCGDGICTFFIDL